MSRIQMLRVFINDRLTAAAEEIFGVFEGMMIEYEEEIYRRKRKMDAVLKSEKKHRAVRPQSFGCEEEQQGRRLRLDQENPEPPHIKASQKETCQAPAGAERSKVTSPLVKSENDEEEPRSSLLSQTEPEPLAGTSSDRVKTEADGEDRGGPGAAGSFGPAGEGQLLSSDCSETETEGGHVDWKETGESPSAVNDLNPERPEPGQTSTDPSHEPTPSDHAPSSLWCKVCGAAFPHKMSLTRHVKAHPRDCGLCGKHLEPAESLQVHLAGHRKCHVCGKRFTSVTDVERHLSTHTGQKPFSCLVCGKTFAWKDNMKVHMRTHTGDRPFSCPVCGKTFGQKGNLMKHMRGHTGERPYSCTFCGKGFIEKGNLQKHMRIHTGEKPYSCGSCGKCFNQMPHLKKHKCRTESSGCRAEGEGLC
ncbi:uncharacterized protein LOC139925871 [Centroberyx gerrardi]